MLLLSSFEAKLVVVVASSTFPACSEGNDGGPSSAPLIGAEDPHAAAPGAAADAASGTAATAERPGAVVPSRRRLLPHVAAELLPLQVSAAVLLAAVGLKYCWDKRKVGPSAAAAAAGKFRSNAFAVIFLLDPGVCNQVRDDLKRPLW